MPRASTTGMGAYKTQLSMKELIAAQFSRTVLTKRVLKNFLRLTYK